MNIEREKDLGKLGRLYLGRFGADPRRRVEFVDTIEPGVPRERKWVLMVSTQFGCPVGCLFCDAGALGFAGNLSANQILAQIEHVVASRPELDACRHPKFKVHFARMGEPSLNKATLRALERLHARFPSAGLLPSLSTVAPLGGRSREFFEELLRVKNARFRDGRFQLQFSLHGLSPQERDRVVPIAKWTLRQIADYGARFVSPGDRKVTLNFAAAPGTRIDPRVLKDVFATDRFLVKITPVNPTARARSSETANPWSSLPAPLREDADGLREAGFRVISSPSAQEEIDAATSCGQLWALHAQPRKDGTSGRGYAGTLSRSREPVVYASGGGDRRQRLEIG